MHDDPRLAVREALAYLSLPSLDNPGALISMMGSMVEDHDHFRQLLVACEPAQRTEMYNALRPNLRFVPRALDQYISDAGRIAAERQLPLQGEDGKLHPYRVPEVESASAIIARAMEESLAQDHLTLTCRKCTKQETFHGLRKADCVFAARQAGWSYDEIDGKGFEVCPECPAIRQIE